MMRIESMFDPSHYANVRRPLLEAETMPAWCYTSEQFLEREIERIFLKTWIFVGRADEVANAGDYFTTHTAGGPVMILRDRDGRVRAFANTCRHRGSRLVEGKGNCRAIICPYHGWTYGLDGALAGALYMEQTKGFDRSKYGLTPVRVEGWGGFLFINYDHEAEPLMDFLGDMPRRFASYKFQDMVCTRRTTYELACNWKLVIENSIEDYHTASVHRTTLGMQVAEPPTPPPAGNWDHIFLPGTQSVAVLPHEKPSFSPIPGLEGKLAHGTNFTVIYPNTQFACAIDCMWWLTFAPKGPERCTASFGFCFPKSSVALPSFEEAVKKYYHRWDAGIAEDNGTGELQQAGLRSILHKPGPMSWKEAVVHRIYNWVLDRVLDER